MKRFSRRRRFRKRYLLLILLAVALLAALYQCGRWLETRDAKPETRGDPNQRYVYDTLIEYDGGMYRPRQEITTVLLMGVDQAQSEANGYRTGGQADFLQLMVIDHGADTVTPISIDRDTMTPITVLSVLGKPSGIRNAQIALSHGFGDGKQQSCEYTVEAVSNLCYGISIDFYLALNMDGIAELNDLLGGITVQIPTDLTQLDAAMTQGNTLRLTGEQAEKFVRSRRGVGDGTNAGRMARQEIYVSGAMEQIQARIREDKEFAGSLYDGLTPYLVTNVSRGKLINETWQAREYSVLDTVRPQGTYETDDNGFMQFYVDEELLQRTVLELFFEKVQ